MTYIQTYKGRKLDFLKPDPKEIDIEDIAHALSNICRFSGHSKFHYSVAQHSVFVAQLVPSEHQLTALLHDATEAYIGDMVTPLKRIIPDFAAYEKRLWAVMADKWELPNILPKAVKDADLKMLAVEARDLMGGIPKAWGLPKPSEAMRIYPWTPDFARVTFMQAYQKYTGEYGRAMLTAYAAP